MLYAVSHPVLSMNLNRTKPSKDYFTPVAFLLIGTVVGSIGTAVMLIIKNDRVISSLHSQIAVLESNQSKRKNELNAIHAKSSIEVAKHRAKADDAESQSTKLKSELDELKNYVANIEKKSEPSEQVDTIKATDPTTSEKTASTITNQVTQPQSSSRQWHSKTGTSISAKLLDCDVDKKTATLLKPDGTIVTVSFDDLSVDDVAYCVTTSQSGDLALAANDDDVLRGLEAITETSVKTINAAINECAERVTSTYESDSTTIQKTREYSAAQSNLLNAVKGARMQIHFLVEDISNPRSLGRDRRKVDLSLAAPDIPLIFSNLNENTGNVIRVITSTDLAESINKGDVIRVIGRINEPSRKTFAALRLTYQLPGVLYNFAANQRSGEFVPSPSPGDKATSVNLGFYIEHMRKLNTDEVKAYMSAQKSREVKE
jgi:hypothetical protein